MPDRSDLDEAGTARPGVPILVRRQTIAAADRATSWGLWGRWFLLFSVIGAVWALSLPLYAGPDEQAHITKAAAVVRGQLIGENHTTDIGSYTEVTVPEAFSDDPASAAKRCYAGYGRVPASCASVPTDAAHGADEVRAITYVGTYPPAYYAAVGWPTLLWADVDVLPFLRLMSVVLGAMFLASAMATAAEARRRSRLLAGVVLATTPMVIFLVSVVNPNGLEIAGAISSAAAVCALSGAEPQDGRRLVRRALVGFVACTASRTPSLAFALLAVALPALAVRRTVAWRSLPLRLITGVLVATSAVAVGWAVSAPTGSMGDARTRESVATSIGETWRNILQAIGHFGELDTPLPLLLALAWLVPCSGLIVVALWRGTGSQRAAVVLAIVAALAIPVAAQAMAVPPVGANWQGRYGLPALVLIPIVAGAVVPATAVRTGVLRLGLVLAAVVQVGAFFVVLRRYSVGTDGPVWFFAAGSWRSPGVLVAAFVSMALAWGVALRQVVARIGPSTP